MEEVVEKMEEVSQHEYETLAAFRHSIRKFLHFSEQAAREAGLPPRQHQALLAIRGAKSNEPLTVGDLANLLVSKPHTVSELVNRLEMQGLVMKCPGKQDARQVVIELTKEGVETLAILTAAHRDELRRLGPVLVKLLSRFSDIKPID
ncbi:MAG: winged helix-turn-helix transcriptional regulator [Candidatus Eremiobacteraeota bacterium]|nr:winged helix-turn-helix transcriptional regulator [Candidatus Eremiobacteraeota bacterium]